MKSELLLWEEIAYLLTLWTAQGFALLTVKPANTAVKVGQPITVLTCSISNNNDIADWWWIPTGQTELIPIFQSHTLVYLYEGHMTVDKGPNGQYNLVIHNITFSDAGKYTCFDDGRLQSAVDNGYYASAELVVTGPELNCTHNMSAGGVLGGDIFHLGLEPDYILLICSLAYKGNIVPTIRLSIDGGEPLSPVTTDVVQKEKYFLLITSTVVRANERMNGSSIICWVDINWNENSNLNGYQHLNIAWTSSVINLLFINNRSIEDSSNISETFCISAYKEIVCFIHNNIGCQYKWIHPSGTIVVLSNVLKPSQFTDWVGAYQCAVECQVRGQTCRIKAKTVVAVHCPKNESTTMYNIINVSTETPILHLALLIGSIIYVLFLLSLTATVLGLKKYLRHKSNRKRVPLNKSEENRTSEIRRNTVTEDLFEMEIGVSRIALLSTATLDERQPPLTNGPLGLQSACSLL